MHAIANPDQPGSAAPLFFGARNSSFALSKYRRLNRLVEVPGRNLKSAIRHLKSSEAWCLLQRGEEQIPVPVIVEDRLPPVAAIHHVVIAPGYSALNLWAMPGEWPSPHHVTISRYQDQDPFTRRFVADTILEKVGVYATYIAEGRISTLPRESEPDLAARKAEAEIWQQTCACSSL